MPDLRTDLEKSKEIVKLFEILKQNRYPYEARIDEVIKFVNHSRRKIVDRDATKGGKTGIDVYDGTAISAANILTDGLCGHTATPAMIWYKYTLPGKLNFPRTSGMRSWSGKRMDEYPQVREWLTDCEDVTWSAFLRSNFYDSIPEFIHDGVTIGTVTQFMEEDLQRDRIAFIVPHFRECYFAENQYGVVDTLFRWYKLSLRNLLDKFGIDKMIEVYPSFKMAFKSDPYQEKEILHAIFPRRDLDPYQIDKKNMPMASFWLALDSQNKILEENGYIEQPFVTWRWRKNNDEICGRSPAWDAYVSIMTGNQQGRDNLIAGHKSIYPPMVMPETLRGKYHDEPKGITFVQSMEREMPRPLVTNMQIPYGIDQQEFSKKTIREFFYVDFFMMLNRAAMEKVELTATQTVGMQAEQAAVLGIRTGRLGSEAYNPIHDRVFAIEERNRRIPAPPQILLDASPRTKIEIDYIGPLAQVQKRLFKYQSINAGLEFLSKIGTIAPEVLDRVDLEQGTIEALDAISWPANCLNSEEKVAKIRQTRQVKRDTMETIQGAAEAAKAVQRTSKAVEPGSPMEAIMGKREGMA